MKHKKRLEIKSPGFKVPKGYFENLDGRVLENLNDNKVLGKVTSSGFTIPNDYFETVGEQIIEKVKTDETPVYKLPLRRKLYYVAGVAAALVIALSIVLNNEATTQISSEMVESYFQNSGLNSYELAELLNEAEFLDDNFNIVESKYNEDNLESYLLEHVDFETIIE